MEPMEQDSIQPPVDGPQTCGICLAPPRNAIELPCSHTFCFLCVKGTLETTGKCALCRWEIPLSFNFIEHDILGNVHLPKSSDGNYWFYKGYQGWWLYDGDTTTELENAWNRGDETFKKVIAGSTYIIDFRDMTQRREDGDGNGRQVCRAPLDFDTILGLAGIRGHDFEGMLEMMRFQDNFRQPGQHISI